jgi:rRNA maturation endonuclease Nob1
VGKAADWLREERRNVLGHWAAVCLGCGAARRWFEDFEADVPETCPQCGGEMLRRCPGCNAPFSSAFAVECESCGGALRDPDLFGGPIRRA